MTLLDFQQPIEGDGYRIYYPFEGMGTYVFTPDKLLPAVRADGLPELQLQIYRGANPMLPPEPYGLLDMRLEPRYPFEEALAALRELHPRARLEPALFSGGYFRLVASAGAEWPEEACLPTPLNANDFASVRSVLRLSLNGAQFVKELLTRDMLPVRAQAELELPGMAPRLPVKAAFDPKPLFQALTGLCDEAGLVSRNALVRFFSMDPETIGLSLEGEISSRAELAETLTDWIRTRYGSLAAAPFADGLGYMSLSLPNSGSGRAEWDLSQPTATRRPLVLSLNPFDSARLAVVSSGQEAIVPPPIVVPPLTTGFHQVDITANIPEPGPGVSVIGVTIRAEPHPPARPQAVVAGTELLPLSAAASVRLQLSPLEPLKYTFSSYIVVEDSRGIRQFDGPETAGSGERLLLRPDDFPVRFVPLAISRDLCEMATIQGLCEWLEKDGISASSEFVLDSERPRLAVAIPSEASDAKLFMEMKANDGDCTLRLGPLPAEPLLLGLHLFPEYGPQRVSIELAEAAPSALVAIDLLPENREETAEAVTVLALTRAQPKKEWDYFASSPFYPGFRYRRHAGAGQTPEIWSEIQSPFERLVLDS